MLTKLANCLLRGLINLKMMNKNAVHFKIGKIINIIILGSTLNDVKYIKTIVVKKILNEEYECTHSQQILYTWRQQE